MRQHTPTVKRIRLDVFPGAHGLTYAITVRHERAGRLDTTLVRRGTLPYPADVADIDGYDLLRTALEGATRAP